jgi:hypothetical protein
LSLDHLQVSLRGEPAGYVDAVLRRQKHRRLVSLTVGHFLVAPPILAATDLVATEPARILRPSQTNSVSHCDRRRCHSQHSTGTDVATSPYHRTGQCVAARSHLEDGW